MRRTLIFQTLIIDLKLQLNSSQLFIYQLFKMQLSKKYKKDVDPRILDKRASFGYQRRFTDQLDQYYETYSESHKAFPYEQCLQRIRQELGEMYDFGFDFAHTSHVQLGQRFPSYEWINIGLPKLYLRFVCSPCPKSKKNKSNFTSGRGTADLRLKIIPINIFNEQCSDDEKIRLQKGTKFSTPFMIIYDFKIYSMACQRCKQWREGNIYLPFLLLLIDILCEKIFYLLTGQKSQPQKNVKTRDLNRHKKSLCEACRKGKCGTFRR